VNDRLLSPRAIRCNSCFVKCGLSESSEYSMGNVKLHSFFESIAKPGVTASQNAWLPLSWYWDQTTTIIQCVPEKIRSAES
jgi:hypothetical protein